MSNAYYLVKYNNYKDGEKIADYLKNNNFRCTAGNYGCPWYFISIYSKTYKPGRPGVAYGSIIGNKEITVNEFIKINESYKNNI